MAKKKSSKDINRKSKKTTKKSVRKKVKKKLVKKKTTTKLRAKQEKIVTPLKGSAPKVQNDAAIYKTWPSWGNRFLEALDNEKGYYIAARAINIHGQTMFRYKRSCKKFREACEERFLNLERGHATKEDAELQLAYKRKILAAVPSIEMHGNISARFLRNYPEIMS